MKTTSVPHCRPSWTAIVRPPFQLESRPTEGGFIPTFQPSRATSAPSSQVGTDSGRRGARVSLARGAGGQVRGRASGEDATDETGSEDPHDRRERVGARNVALGPAAGAGLRS